MKNNKENPSKSPFVYKYTIYLSVACAVVGIAFGGMARADQELQLLAFVPYKVWSQKYASALLLSKIELNQSIPNYIYSSSMASPPIVDANTILEFQAENVDYNSDFQVTAVSSLASLPAATSDLQLTLQKGQIAAHNFNLTAAIKRDLGYGTATLHVSMHCDAVYLDLKTSQSAQIRMELNQGLFNITQLNWNLQNIEVSTRLVGCNALAGFDKILQQQVQQVLQQSFVIETLKSVINDKLNPAITAKINATIQSYLNQVSSIQLSKLNNRFDNQNNLWIGSDQTLSKDSIFTSEQISTLSNAQTMAVLVKKGNIEAVALQSLNKIIAPKVISSNQYSDMRRLTCSRLIQFFVWPSLRSLSKCFEMQIQNQVQQIQLNSANPLNFALKVGSWASGSGHQIAYFQSQLSIELQPRDSFIDGAPSVNQLQAKMTSFKGTAYPAFIAWSGRSKRISTSLIQPALEELLTTQVTKMKNDSNLAWLKKSSKIQSIDSETLLVQFDNSFAK